eukprot:GHVQ01012639.1.p1 GENE.GHVQ01012639.1~~GHVQ01012639.1.p1  ORF type:complete len:561 (+),score=75.36 GHVQ01012639.1:254-1936(+)
MHRCHQLHRLPWRRFYSLRLPCQRVQCWSSFDCRIFARTFASNKEQHFKDVDDPGKGIRETIEIWSRKTLTDAANDASTRGLNTRRLDHESDQHTVDREAEETIARKRPEYLTQKEYDTKKKIQRNLELLNDEKIYSSGCNIDMDKFPEQESLKNGQLSTNSAHSRVLIDDKQSMTTTNQLYHASTADEDEDSNERLTPAQRFFKDNKDKLMSRAQQYYREKNAFIRKEAKNGDELSYDDDGDGDADSRRDEEDSFDAQNDWTSFYRDPVVRPPKRHLWEIGNLREHVPKKEIELEKGVLPTIQQFIELLEQESVTDVRTVDLEECGRRDVGVYSVIGTGLTPAHCKRVGKLICKLVIQLEIPYVSASSYCWGGKTDEWIIAHCGPVKINIMVPSSRQSYKLEELYLIPHEHMEPTQFPGYFDETPPMPPPYVLRAASAPRSYVNSDSLHADFVANRTSLTTVDKSVRRIDENIALRQPTAIVQTNLRGGTGLSTDVDDSGSSVIVETSLWRKDHDGGSTDRSTKDIALPTPPHKFIDSCNAGSHPGADRYTIIERPRCQ